MLLKLVSTVVPVYLSESSLEFDAARRQEDKLQEFNQ